MGKIVPDRSGDVRKGVFYEFHVPFDDGTDSQKPARDWIVVPRTPTDDALRANGEEPYLWISPLGSEGGPIETKDCAGDAGHVTHSYHRSHDGEACGGRRTSPLIPMNILNSFALSDEFRRRVASLKLRGAYVVQFNLQENPSGKKVRGFWSFQFVGKARLRLPKFEGVKNECPHCGKGKNVCESCGQWNPYCSECRKEMTTPESMHKGTEDKRIPFEDGLWSILEGKSWDGSDLIQTSGGWRCFASKRFIDWLLRVHAAPFYAEPVWFCVDGMNDKQQRWFKDLEIPLEA